MSRPFLIQLLEEKKLPFRMVGTHRRVRFEDVLSYKQAIDAERRKVLDELAVEAQDLDMRRKSIRVRYGRFNQVRASNL